MRKNNIIILLIINGGRLFYMLVACNVIGTCFSARSCDFLSIYKIRTTCFLAVCLFFPLETCGRYDFEWYKNEQTQMHLVLILFWGHLCFELLQKVSSSSSLFVSDSIWDKDGAASKGSNRTALCAINNEATVNNAYINNMRDNELRNKTEKDCHLANDRSKYEDDDSVEEIKLSDNTVDFNLVNFSDVGDDLLEEYVQCSLAAGIKNNDNYALSALQYPHQQPLLNKLKSQRASSNLHASVSVRPSVEHGGDGYASGHPPTCGCSKCRGCSFCGKHFSTIGSRKRHERDKHLNTQYVECDLCGKFCKNKGALIKHKSLFHRPKLSHETLADLNYNGVDGTQDNGLRPFAPGVVSLREGGDANSTA